MRSVISPAPDQQTGGSEIRYLVTITSIKRSYFAPQKSIIPFHAYNLDENTLVDLRSLGTGTPDLDPLPRSATPETPFHPGPVLKRSPLELLLVDIKTAKHIATTWTVTDGYYFAGRQPKEPAGGTSSPTVTINPSLVDAASRTGSPPLHHSMDRQNRRGYRGLWWGAERIWVGDLLILSFPESSISYPREDSSCFAHDIRAGGSFGDVDISPDHRKPEERRVFLKLRALAAVRAADGVGTEVEAIGSVYRLAPSLDSVRTTGPEFDDLGLPRPPDGFIFRAVLSTSIEARLPVCFIRGRYYPQVLSSADKDFVPVERGLKAMEGLGPVGSVVGRPSKHMVVSRDDMLSVAQELANGNS